MLEQTIWKNKHELSLTQYIHTCVICFFKVLDFWIKMYIVRFRFESCTIFGKSWNFSLTIPIFNNFSIFWSQNTVFVHQSHYFVLQNYDLKISITYEFTANFWWFSYFEFLKSFKTSKIRFHLTILMLYHLCGSKNWKYGGLSAFSTLHKRGRYSLFWNV